MFRCCQIPSRHTAGHDEFLVPMSSFEDQTPSGVETTTKMVSTAPSFSTSPARSPSMYTASPSMPSPRSVSPGSGGKLAPSPDSFIRIYDKRSKPRKQRSKPPKEKEEEKEAEKEEEPHESDPN
eukprot:Gregarina_sp_Pseudo_9__2716@NODE_295_length_3258_cov_23_063063_g276_i0_p6_GENE_NODE_295_length_3258_cov_23_063063_g276_i0NODE_295_length_3258_cov_23_063063_g276_i0_p6_ORF_typecomplete_len124_score30_01_NODE_295_length_3258_cov_23_063063_g276_i0238609